MDSRRKNVLKNCEKKFYNYKIFIVWIFLTVNGYLKLFKTGKKSNVMSGVLLKLRTIESEIMSTTLRICQVVGRAMEFSFSGNSDNLLSYFRYLVSHIGLVLMLLTS